MLEIYLKVKVYGELIITHYNIKLINEIKDNQLLLYKVLLSSSVIDDKLGILLISGVLLFKFIIVLLDYYYSY
jgi:hypothetical protein